MMGSTDKLRQKLREVKFMFAYRKSYLGGGEVCEVSVMDVH